MLALKVYSSTGALFWCLPDVHTLLRLSFMFFFFFLCTRFFKCFFPQVPVPLNSDDLLFSTVRDLHVEQLMPFLQGKVGHLLKKRFPAKPFFSHHLVPIQIPHFNACSIAQTVPRPTPPTNLQFEWTVWWGRIEHVGLGKPKTYASPISYI